MGWTGEHAVHYKNGKIDRIAQVESALTWSDGRYVVIKSALVGSTVYSAIKHTREDGGTQVFAVITLTQTDMRDYYNFYYKSMTEFEGVYYADKCPKSIMKLLTPLPLDEVWALEWRNKVYEYHASRKGKTA